MTERLAPMVHHLFATDGLADLVQPEAGLYLLLVALILWGAGKWYAARLPYPLVKEIASVDNPAAAISYAGFSFGLGLALFGALTAPGLPSLWHDLLDMAGLGVFATLLLGLGRTLNDHFAFPKTDLRAEVAKGNIAAAIVQFSSFTSTGLIVMRAIAIDGTDELARALDTTIFFLAAQVAIVAFVAFYERITKYDLRAEIADGNPAAGMALGLTLIAVGVTLSYAILETGSLIVFGVWFVMSSLLLWLMRSLVNRVLLPGHDLDQEIARDRNWGVATLEGSTAIALGWIITGAF
jgi:uncharacterized membrane protein YjfL (UPF0719 family)